MVIQFTKELIGRGKKSRGNGGSNAFSSKKKKKRRNYRSFSKGGGAKKKRKQTALLNKLFRMGAGGDGVLPKLDTFR